MTQAAKADTGGPSLIRTWAPLLAVCLGFFVVVLDSTMMNVANAGDLNTTVAGVRGTISLLLSLLAASFLSRRQLEAEVGPITRKPSDPA